MNVDGYCDPIYLSVMKENQLRLEQESIGKGFQGEPYLRRRNVTQLDSGGQSDYLLVDRGVSSTGDVKPKMGQMLTKNDAEVPHSTVEVSIDDDLMTFSEPASDDEEFILTGDHNTSMQQGERQGVSLNLRALMPAQLNESMPQVLQSMWRLQEFSELKKMLGVLMREYRTDYHNFLEIMQKGFNHDIFSEMLEIKARLSGELSLAGERLNISKVAILLIKGGQSNGKTSAIWVTTGFKSKINNELGTRMAYHYHLQNDQNLPFKACVWRESEGYKKAREFDDRTAFDEYMLDFQNSFSDESTIFDDVLHIQAYGKGLATREVVDFPGEISKDPSNDEHKKILDKLYARYTSETNITAWVLKRETDQSKEPDYQAFVRKSQNGECPLSFVVRTCAADIPKMREPKSLLRGGHQGSIAQFAVECDKEYFEQGSELLDMQGKSDSIVQEKLKKYGSEIEAETNEVIPKAAFGILPFNTTINWLSYSLNRLEMRRVLGEVSNQRSISEKFIGNNVKELKRKELTATHDLMKVLEYDRALWHMADKHGLLPRFKMELEKKKYQYLGALSLNEQQKKDSKSMTRFKDSGVKFPGKMASSEIGLSLTEEKPVSTEDQPTSNQLQVSSTVEDQFVSLSVSPQGAYDAIADSIMNLLLEGDYIIEVYDKKKNEKRFQYASLSVMRDFNKMLVGKYVDDVTPEIKQFARDIVSVIPKLHRLIPELLEALTLTGDHLLDFNQKVKDVLDEKVDGVLGDIKRDKTLVMDPVKNSKCLAMVEAHKTSFESSGFNEKVFHKYETRTPDKVFRLIKANKTLLCASLGILGVGGAVAIAAATAPALPMAAAAGGATTLGFALAKKKGVRTKVTTGASAMVGKSVAAARSMKSLIAKQKEDRSESEVNFDNMAELFGMADFQTGFILNETLDMVYEDKMLIILNFIAEQYIKNLQSHFESLKSTPEDYPGCASHRETQEKEVLKQLAIVESELKKVLAGV